MTSDYWLYSERLINTVLPLVLLISCAICFVLVGLLSSQIKKNVIVILLGIVILVNLIIGSVIFYVTSDYRDLKEYESYINRNVEAGIFRYNSQTYREIKGYTLEDLKRTAKLPFYQLKEVETSDLVYLGKDDHLYFFEKEEIIYRTDINNGIVTFNQSVEEPIVRRKYAVLTDSSFEGLEFKKEVGPVIEKIILPTSQITKTYQAKVPTKKL